MQNFTLKDINFIGYADGETEAESTEYNFVDLFYTGNYKYEDIMKPTKFIISGRKGTGKTILAKYVEFEQNNINKKFFKTLYVKLPDDIKNHEFIERNYSEIKEDEYILFPKYYILKKIADIIINNKINFISYISNNFNISALFDYYSYLKSYKFLKKIFNERYPSGNYVSKKLQKEISGSSSITLDLKLKTKLSSQQNESIKEELQLKNYNYIINDIEFHITNCLKIINIMLFFDDIDDIKNYITNIEKLKKFLIGFIKGIREININLKRINDKNKCIIIIRDDILNSLNSSDSNLNKIIIDSNVNLDWIGNNQTDTLFEMICNKIKKSNKKFENIETNQILNLFINDIHIKDRIIENSFGRPRDIISYLNLIVKNNKTQKTITYDMVKSVNNVYSNSFWGELKNELFFSFSETYISEIEILLSSFGQKIFKYSEIENFYLDNKNNYTEITNLDELMTNLYKFGIIGNLKTEKNKKPKAFFYYRSDGKSMFSKNDKIIIHYGLQKALKMS